MDYDILPNSNSPEGKAASNITENSSRIAMELLTRIKETFEQQYSGWWVMNIFERQWVLRDFKKAMGISAEQASEKLNILYQQSQDDFSNVIAEQYFFDRLRDYWGHQLQLLKGYEKDKNKLIENTQIINGWIHDIESLLTYIKQA
jgi:predicted AAA+ superfamily ATPase